MGAVPPSSNSPGATPFSNPHAVVVLKEVCKSFQDNRILDRISFEVRHGEFLTLLGPSGCGKTTLLRLLAGLELPDSGDIMIDGRNMRAVPPQARHVNTVFQNYALFPHLSVFENVAFGLKCKRRPAEEVRERTQAVLRRVKLEALSQRRPHQLSGGQQQRVAIARAVVNQPRVLLLDEPLSSLDYRLRKTLQLELKALQAQLGIAFIFVTHDQEEALSLSDRIVVMDEGHIEQIGSPREVYESPRNLKVARFIGEANLFGLEILAASPKQLTVRIEGKVFSLENRGCFEATQPLCMLVRPEDLQVWAPSEIEKQETEQMFPGIVTQVIYKGSTVDLMVRLESGRLLAVTQFFNEDDETLDFEPGEPIFVHWIPGWEVILPDAVESV